MTRMDSLEPDFRAKVLRLILSVEEATARTWAISDGRRTMDRQRYLYAQGRTTPGKVVTMAPPGQSAHNFGLAADLWPVLPTGDFDWGADDALFRQMADLAKEQGLTPGYYFHSIHDAPHVEDPSWKLAQAAWKAGDLKVA